MHGRSRLLRPDWSPAVGYVRPGADGVPARVLPVDHAGHVDDERVAAGLAVDRRHGAEAGDGGALRPYLDEVVVPAGAVG